MHAAWPLRPLALSTLPHSTLLPEDVKKKKVENQVAVKSSLRAIFRDKSGPLSFRLSFFGGTALKPGPAPLRSAFPSTSSSGRDDAAAVCAAVLGSFEGCVGYGSAKKYG
jgi:hypothetical protein